MIEHKTFTVSRKGWGWFRVRVFATLDDLQNDYAEKWPDDQEPPSAWFLPLGQKHFLGEMVLYLDNTRQGVVHECFHAACEAWRRHRTNRISISANVGSKGYERDRGGRGEEAFAYLLQDFTELVLDGCDELGMWS